MATSPSASNRSPASLKGITSTNVNPHACAVCSSPFPLLNSTLFFGFSTCCGKRFCLDCHRAGKGYIPVPGRTGRGPSPSSAFRCLFCKFPVVFNSEAGIGPLKKHAKKGAPWAQFVLGWRFEHGYDSLPRSLHDAKRWYEKAAKQGHPEATCSLAAFFLTGAGGCPVNLPKARVLAEKAVTLDDNVSDQSLPRCLLVMIADRVDDKEAKSILMPLAEEGMPLAQYQLGRVFVNQEGKDSLDAKKLFEAAALQGDLDAARNALAVCWYKLQRATKSCEEIQNVPEVNFWVNIVSKNFTRDDPDYRKVLEHAGRVLRTERNFCAECRITLEGDRRQYCRQCMACCYCSRDCQKLHWNRDRGHRSECMAVHALKEKMKSHSSGSCSGK